MKSDVDRNDPDERISDSIFGSWALWWGISLGLAFLAAGTIGFTLSTGPYADKSGQAEITPQHRPKALGVIRGSPNHGARY
jgi:hypothetical protein